MLTVTFSVTDRLTLPRHQCGASHEGEDHFGGGRSKSCCCLQTGTNEVSFCKHQLQRGCPKKTSKRVSPSSRTTSSQGFEVLTVTFTDTFPSLRQAMTGYDRLRQAGGGKAQRRRKHNRFNRKLGENERCLLGNSEFARLGLEPRQTDSESVVLPLHHRATSDGCAA